MENNKNKSHLENLLELENKIKKQVEFLEEQFNLTESSVNCKLDNAKNANKTIKLK